MILIYNTTSTNNNNNLAVLTTTFINRNVWYFPNICFTTYCSKPVQLQPFSQRSRFLGEVSLSSWPLGS